MTESSMRRLSSVVLAVALAVAHALPTRGQTISWEKSPESATERAVALVDSLRLLALLRGDTLMVRQVYAADFQSVLPTGALRSRAEFLRDLASGQQRYDAVWHIGQRIRVIGEVAIITGRSTQRGQEAHSGAGMVPETRYARIYVRRRGKWQLLLTQLTRIESSSGGAD